jgi:DNA-binding transcriptional MerR regulator
MEITLRELCEMVGVSRRSIQCYEKAGLMRAQGKNKYGYLIYDEGSLERARQIHFLQELGFELKEIKSLNTLPKEAQKEGIAEKIENLRHRKKETEELIKQAERYLKEL